MPRLHNSKLLSVSKAPKAALDYLQFGIELYRITGDDVEALRARACQDRFLFAVNILKVAHRAQTARPTQNRIVVARAYYAMYHAARALAYFYHGGDDFEDHKKVPSHLPQDFPDRAVWENQLKNARLERNKADYDPYPETDAAFASAAAAAIGNADSFLTLGRAYLVRNGCQV